MKALTIPLSDEAVRDLKVGDSVALNGLLLTGRDMVHKWLVDTFIRKTRPPQGDDAAVYAAIRPWLDGGVIYHCGPVVAGLDTKNYRFVAAGPTTSIREEPYQGEVMRHFNLRGVIGKGGMGPRTLAACREVPGVYLHAIGGAASLIAQTVRRVVGVFKLEFGVPEAIWVIEVESQHAAIAQKSQAALEALLASG
jgi:tartrate/fumarate subfamily iron-sulfur-dependent hydro-lyase beta chain